MGSDCPSDALLLEIHFSGPNQGRIPLGRTHAWLLPKSAHSTYELPPTFGGERFCSFMNQSAPFCTHMATIATSQTLGAHEHSFCMEALRALGSGFASYPQQKNHDSNSQQHLYYSFPLHLLIS